ELSRNDKCSCGSNKKFKKCCGKYKYERGSQFKIMLEDEIQLEPLKTAFDQISPAG
ncbi:SEC-C metal-binding domain-containing protein, partial [Staphylococcus pseudintermedius]|uniref:SEC-C metal-binding domain-containing protein n=1 Tax=Staphylococcus pseudintermedius TaxID=283734 RepID=UPI003F9D74FB